MKIGEAKLWNDNIKSSNLKTTMSIDSSKGRSRLNSCIKWGPNKQQILLASLSTPSTVNTNQIIREIIRLVSTNKNY